MKNKGFTLIELLAVIVILAIIALIATPIILNIIGNAKDESNKRTKELYLDAVKDAIARKNLTEEFNPSECTVKEDGNLLCGDRDLLVEVSGIKPCSGTITFDKKGKITNETVKYCNGNNEPQEDDKEYVDSSGANTPDLMNSLTPVIYNTDHWEIADTTKEWYDYDNQEWANAVILSDAGKSKTLEDTLDLEKDVLAMFVWIPRYSYTISSEAKGDADSKGKYPNPREIEINFIAKDTIESTEGYTVHPTFTFDKKQLSGIWVGKFETSHIASGTQSLTCIDEACADADNLRILPNVVSLRSNPVSKFFYASRSMTRKGNAFKLDSTKTDSHMMKNSEWGAVAYLTQSKYGKYGNSAYDGTIGKEKEVYINNCSNYITGIAGESVSSASSATCTNTYETETGWKASTTGNITGIYDMSGGADEYVMGVYKKTIDLSKFTDDFFTNQKNEKYYDNYTGKDDNNEVYNGHALDETSGWYGDYADFVTSWAPWFLRGGYHNYASGTGMFNYNFNYGGSINSSSFRVVFVPTT